MRLPWNRRGRDRRDAELDEEIRAHFSMAVADRIARGESPDDAAAAARREFGNVGRVKETTRETWGGVWLDQLRQDVHYAFRSLRRAPGFTTAAVVTFALGIGVNTAMFTVVNSILLRPLPFRDPGRLFIVSHVPANGMLSSEPGMFDRQYVSYRTTTRAFEATTSYNVFPATLTRVGEPARISTVAVTEGFFRVLGTLPAIGRAFTADDHGGGANKTVILSDAIWRDRFSADPQAIGRTLDLDGERRTIVGVMPPGFDFPSGAQLWFPTHYEYDPHRIALRPVLGRLAAGATTTSALRELEAFVRADERDRPDDRVEQTVNAIIPLKQRVVGKVQQSLLIFAGAVAFVLLIGCANVANLLLMRASTRQHEISIRAAIGAERPRLVRQLLTESLVLAFCGGLLGLAVASVGVQILLAMAPAGLLPRVGEIHLDATVLAVTALVCVVAGISFGIVPALHATRRDLRGSLTSAHATAGVVRTRLRSVLVTAECALAVLLLVGAGLLMRSFLRLRSVDLGFQPRNVVTFTVDLPDDRYATTRSMQEFRERTMAELERLPGVTDAAVVNWRPLSRSFVMGDFVLADGRKLPDGFLVLKPSVTPNYFRVMSIRLREGRAFTERDDEPAPGVTIISRSVADRLWPGGNAIGQRISMEDKPGVGDWLTIVGIVDDIRQFEVKSTMPAVYLPLAQSNRSFMLNHLSFAARVAGDAAPVERAIRTVLHGVDPLQPVGSIATMQAALSSLIAEPAFQVQLLAAFAVLSVLLAAVGIYGVLAYAVTERTHEIGVRLALGATGDRVAWLVVRRTLAIAGPGIAIGLAAAFGVTRVLRKLLFEISPTDPGTYWLVAALLGTVAVAASVIPARRASRVDPMVALRES
jgi:putative ABC transport system permease protein